MQSPICNEDENENLHCIDLGPSTSEHFRGSPFLLWLSDLSILLHLNFFFLSPCFLYAKPLN